MRKTTFATVLAALTGIVATMLVTFATPANAFVDRDCGDFPNQAAAQAFYIANGGPGSDPHNLDAEGDGRACESLPCPCGSRGPQQPVNNNGGQQQGPRVYRETGNVTKIVDGDTLKVRIRGGGVKSVRMLGINTPERGRCGADDATDNLRRMAPVGSTVHLVSDPSQAATDRYDRLLRYVKKQGGYGDLSFRQAWDGFTKRYVFNRKPVARDREYTRAISYARRNVRGAGGKCWVN